MSNKRNVKRKESAMTLTTLFIKFIFFWLVLFSYGEAQQPEKNKTFQAKQGKKTETENREKKIVEALKLCGDSYLLSSVTYKAEAKEPPDFEAVKKIQSLANEVLFDGGTGSLAERFPLAARKVAAEVPKGGFVIQIDEWPSLQEIQAILGKEDSIESGSIQTLGPSPTGVNMPVLVSITWYKYGWCWFGVNDKKVVALQADCRAIKIVEFKEALVLAAEKIELKKAYQGGKLKLTFTAKDEGKTVDLTIKNVSSTQLVIFVEKGNTVFETSDRKIFLVSPERKEVELTAEAEKTLEFPIEQEGVGRWTSGSIILSVPPKEDKKP